MRLEQLGDISSDYFSIKTNRMTNLLEFTGFIATKLQSFKKLDSDSPIRPVCSIDKNGTSIIRLDGVVIEIEQIGYSFVTSDVFLINTRDSMSEPEMRRFYDYLGRRTNGQPHQQYLF